MEVGVFAAWQYGANKIASAKMDALDVRGMVKSAGNLIRVVVDKGDAGADPARKFSQGRTFRALVGNDWKGHAVADKILLALGFAVTGHVGQDQDLRLARQERKALCRPGCGRLVPGLAIDEAVDQRPGLSGIGGAAIWRFDGVQQAVVVQLQVPVLLLQPLAEGQGEMHKDFVSIKDEQGSVGLQIKRRDLPGSFGHQVQSGT